MQPVRHPYEAQKCAVLIRGQEMTKKFRNCGAAISLAVTCVAPAKAWADATKTVDIASQDMVDAIAELGEQGDVQIIGADELLNGKKSVAVKGSMTTKQALTRLLGDASLHVVELSEDTLVISTPDQLNFVSQNADDQPFDLGTILIQGERVERDVFDTTTSVRVYSGDEIEENPQNNDFERVIAETGNVSVIGNSNQTPFIRGQSSAGPTTGAGAALSGQLPRANITVDGRVLTFNELAYSPTSVWDVEAIEVFRGPQTTSQGANSIAGAFNIRTRDPVFEQEAAARFIYGSRDFVQGSVAVNTPLSESVAVRFAYDYQRQDGYINFPAGIPEGSEARSTEQETIRLKLLWEPVNLPQLSSKLTYSYTDFSRPQTQNVVAPFDELNSNNTNGFPSAFVGRTSTLIHDLNYDLGGGFSVFNRLEFSNGNSARVTGNPNEADVPIDTDGWSNELILDYAPDGGALSGIFGIYVQHTEDRSPSGSNIQFDDTKDGLGIFGEATYRFANGFDVTGGLRYQRNDQDRFVDAAFPPVTLDYDGSFDAWLPKFTVGYEPNDDLRYSFQVSRGFNPGGIGGSILGIFGIIPLPDPFFEFQEETVTNYELAMRGRFLDGRLFVAANLFYSDFDDYQFTIPTLLPGGFVDSIVSNAEGVETYGLEIEAQYEATNQLRLIGSLGLLHTEVTEFSGSAEDIVGNELPVAPPVTLSLGLDYDVTDRITIGGQVRYSAGYYSDIQNTEAAQIDDFTLVDLRASYRLNDQAELFGYVNNVFDVVEPVQLFTGGDVGVTTEPLEVGFGVRATF